MPGHRRAKVVHDRQSVMMTQLIVRDDSSPSGGVCGGDSRVPVHAEVYVQEHRHEVKVLWSLQPVEMMKQQSP